MLKNKYIYLVPFLGFLAIILIGWNILILPICNTGNITIFDSFFVASSATCVNGLSTVDISQSYTFIGQVAIALITEIGAIGFVTFISFILNIRKNKMKLSDAILLSSALNDNNLGKLKQRLKEVIKYTLIIELIGAICLSIDFIPRFGIKDGIWYSIFHSITAFCNSGLDLFGTSGLTIFADNVYVNIVFMILMFLGAIGFFIIEDVINCIKKKSFIHMGFNTKIILMTNLIVYISSIILIKLLEPNLTILQVLFLSVTSRTTGFSTINIADTSTMTKICISILMLIGGAPSSTSGGIRITSIATLFLVVESTLRNKKDITIFYKKIDMQIIRQAITNIFLNCIIVVIAILVFARIQDIGLTQILFMCVSALSATGLTVVDVGNLEFASKLLLTLLMFIGRIGPMTIISIFILNKKENKDVEYVSGNLIL